MGVRKDSPEYAAWVLGVRERMRLTRERLGLSFRAAGERTGVPFASIQRVEAGKVDPTPSLLVDLATGYGVPPAELMGPQTTLAVYRVPAKCGHPKEMLDNPPADRIDLAGIFGGRADDVFVVRASGRSMVGCGIQPGDWVAVRRQDTADTGQLVLAWVNGGYVIKRLALIRGKIVLQGEPEGGERESYPFEPERDAVVGVVLGVIHKF